MNNRKRGLIYLTTLLLASFAVFIIINISLALDEKATNADFWKSVKKMTYLDKPADIIVKNEPVKAEYKASDAEKREVKALTDLINQNKKFEKELNAFEKKYPQSPNTPNLYYLAVQHFYEKNDANATAYWANVYFKKFPVSENFEAVLGYYSYIKGIHLEISTQSSFVPGDDVSVYVDSRNQPSVDFEIYLIDPGKVRKPLQLIDPYEFNPGKDNFVKKINKTFSENYFYGSVPIGKLDSGLYTVIARTKELSSATIVSVSRLGIITKSDRFRTLLFAADKITGKPIGDAKILAFANNKLFAEGATGKDGVVALDNKDHSYYYTDFVASSDKDLAFVNIYTYGRNGQSLRAYFYADRPVYRPGQEASFKILIRDRRDSTNYDMPQKKEYKIIIQTSGGKKIFEKKFTINEFGTLADSVRLEDEAELGWYTFRILDENENEIYDSYGNERRAFRVEEYKKPEFKMTLAPVKSSYIKGEEIEIAAEVKYYFGQPVKDGIVEYRVETGEHYVPYWYYYPYSWYYKEYDDYGSSRYQEFYIEGTAKTDKEGKCVIKFKSRDLSHDANYSVRVRVTDKSRRMIEGSASVYVSQAEYRINMSTDRYVYKPGNKVKITYEGINISNNPVPFKGRIKISKYRYFKNKGEYIELVNEEIKTGADGRGIFEYIPDEKGNFYVKITSTDRGGRTVSAERNIYVADYNYEEFFNYSSVNIIFDKDFHYVGEKAVAMIQSPFKDASCLITLENESLVEYRIISIPSSSGIHEFTVTQDHSPNLYYNVTIIKNNSINTQTKNLIIPPKNKFLNIGIKCDKATYRPGEEAELEIKVTDDRGEPVNAEISLGMVDESLYYIQEEFVKDIRQFFYSAVWNYVQTGNSFYTYYYGRRRTGGRWSESKKLMAAEEDAPASAKAESAADSATGKKNGGEKEPEIREYFPDTGYWNARLVTGKKGTVKVKIKMPDTLTTWRSTVRAVTFDTAVGSAKTESITFKPLLCRLELPRFLVQGDSLTVSGIVHNYLKSDIDTRSELTASGAALKSDQSQKKKIASGDDVRFDWKVDAPGAGDAQFILKALTTEESDAMKLTIPVLPHGLKREKVESGFVKEENGSPEITIDVPQSAILESSGLQVLVSGTLAGAMLDSLEYLIGYPYGCVEQTMSRFLPDIIVAQTIQKLSLKKPKILEKLPDMVDKGLKRLYELQHPDGGWGWWTDDETHPYMTAYVVYGLTMARAADYAINQNAYDRGIAALRNLYGKEKFSDTKAYMEYVLSYIKDFKKDDILKLYKEKNSLTLYGKGLLAMALVNAGEKAKAGEIIAELKKKATVMDQFAYFTGESFHYSWERNDIEVTAFILKALALYNADDELLPKIISWLLTKRSGSYWVSTKDTANVVYAFAEYLNKTGELSADFEYKILLNGREIISNKINPANILDPGKNALVKGADLRAGNNTVKIIKNGNGKLYYTILLSYFSFEKEIKPESKNITVSRSYKLVKTVRDKNGNDIENLEPFEEAVYSGDEIEVTISVGSKDNLEYIMIEDFIPAGCEILDRKSENSWWTHQEFRDEKAVFFITRYWHYDTGKERMIKYRLRAEVPGDYEVLPAIASSMYFPNVRANTKSDTLTILERKKAKE